MNRKIFGTIAAFAIGGSAALGVDCGEAPHAKLAIPNGDSAEAENIRVARVAVVAYSNEVDKYLTCMDGRASRILPYLTKEQKIRWDEDLAALHEKRREIQTEMNLAIREFRKANRQ